MIKQAGLPQIIQPGSISWMFGNISPVTAGAGRGFLPRTEDSLSSTADSWWSHGHQGHLPPPLSQSVTVRERELHRWSDQWSDHSTALHWAPFSYSHFREGLHCRPCTDSLRILKLKKFIIFSWTRKVSLFQGNLDSDNVKYFNKMRHWDITTRCLSSLLYGKW